MNPTLPPKLVEQLHHTDHNERSAAVFALRDMDHPEKLPLLVEALQIEADISVREDITYTLTQMGEVAIPALTALLNAEQADARHNAAHVLGKIGHPSAVSALVVALNDSDITVVKKVIFVLSQIGDAAAVPGLVALLGHHDLIVQTTLTTALECFGDMATPALLPATLP